MYISLAILLEGVRIFGIRINFSEWKLQWWLKSNELYDSGKNDFASRGIPRDVGYVFDIKTRREKIKKFLT